MGDYSYYLLQAPLADLELSAIVILNTIRNTGGHEVSPTPPINPSTADTDGTLPLKVESFGGG